MNPTDINVDINVKQGDWPAESVLQDLAERIIGFAISETQLAMPDRPEVSLVFTNDVEVKELNSRWRNKNKSTNVLTFASNDGLALDQWSPLLGDIVLALETINHEAVEQGKEFAHHLTHLMLHGFLHLVGFDHIEDGEAESMEAAEKRILAKLGVADPYTSQ